MDTEQASDSGETEPILKSLTPPAPLPTKLCPEGHPSNPSSDVCMDCQHEFNGAAEVITMAQRAVVKLLLEDGTAVEITNDLLIGRSPIEDRRSTHQPVADRTFEHETFASSATESSAFESNALQNPSFDTLTVTGRQVSRRHLMLITQGWELQVRDCGSTNGTFVSRRGERGRRRVPTDGPMVVRIGDSLHFGSRQALVVRAH